MQAFGWSYYLPRKGSQDEWEWVADWTCGEPVQTGKQAIDNYARVSATGHICAIVLENNAGDDALYQRVATAANDECINYVCQATDGESIWYEVWFNNYIRSVDVAAEVLGQY